MSLDNHFRSVGDIAKTVEAGPVDPLLIYAVVNPKRRSSSASWRLTEALLLWDATVA
mgnify:CR=1 FL=1